MLSYFPQIREDESTYSIFSRLQFDLQPPNFEVMGKMLFNKKSEVGRLNFQGSFDFLCTQLPSSYTSEYFLFNNTIFPIYIPFINKEKISQVINYFKGDYADKVQKCLNLSLITQKREYIRVCKKCVEEDLKIYGEPYYRRQHEIELNRMCAKHRIPLLEYTIFPYKIPSRYNDFYTVLDGAKELKIPDNFKSKFLDIADDISYIFDANLTGWNVDITKDKICNMMMNKGYVSINGLTYQKNFSENFKEYYTEEFLNYIDYNFDIDENDSWLRHATTRKKTIADPVKYLLVIKYLFGSFKNFHEYKDSYSIFNTKPYPCLNKVCPNYNKLVINDYSLCNSHNHPLATFKCEYCGFTYSRRGPDKDYNDIYIRTYVKDYGHIWIEKLEEYSSQGYSLRKMCNLLGCSSTGTIKSYLNKIKFDKISINNVINETDNMSIFSTFDSDLFLVEEYKAMFLKILDENPKMNSLSIFRKYPSAYKMVSRHDRNWIKNNLLKKEVPKLSGNNRLQNYWKDKDEFLYKELVKNLKRIKSKQELYKRITISLLQKYIGYYNLRQNKRNLPKCFKLITLECETIPDYQKRRINFVIKEMADNSAKITIAKVLRNVGLRNTTNQEVLDYVDKIVTEYYNDNLIIR